MSFDFLLGLFFQYGYRIVFAGILLDNAAFRFQANSSSWPSAPWPERGMWI